MAAHYYDWHELEDIQMLESVERRPVLIPDYRNDDLDELDNIDFKRNYRLDKSTVEELLTELSPQLTSSTNRNRALTPAQKILAALRFYAFGIQQINIGGLQHMSQPSANRAIDEVTNALLSLRRRYIYLPQTEGERMEISHRFYQRFGFPGVYGALDCSLIKIQNPGGDSSERFRCRKGFFALNVQTVSDPDLFIRNIVARWPGSTHDSTVFDNSYLRAHIETEVSSKYHLLGDSGYPLRSYLMTPFLHPTTASQRRYNKAHVQARNVVERQYGLWKKRFFCVGSTLRCRVKNAQKIIIATAILHNLALTLGDEFDDKDPVPVEQDQNTIASQANVAGMAKRNEIVANFF